MDDACTIHDLAQRLAAAEERAAKAEASRLHSEARFKVLFSTSPAPLLVVRADAPRFTIAEVNDAYLAATMRTRDQLIGRAMFEAFPDNPDDSTANGVDNLRASFERTLVSHRLDTMAVQKYDVARPDGRFEERWWSPVNSPVMTGDGQVEAIIHHVNDVTEEYRVEAALAENAKRQAFLLKLSDALRPLGNADEIQATTTRLLGEHIGADRAMYAEVTGEAGEETGLVRGQFIRSAAPGRPALALFPEHFSYSSFGTEVMARRYRGEGLAVADVNADPGFDATERAAWARAGVRAAIVAPLVKSNRLVAEVGVQSEAPRIWTDGEISLVREVGERTWAAAERVRAEAASRTSEERFRQFAGASTDVLWIRDAQTFSPTFVSEAARRVYGVDPETLVGEADFWTSLVVPEDRRATLMQLQHAAEGGREVQEFRIRRPSDGAFRWISRTAFPLLDERGYVQAVAGISSDVSEARQLSDHRAVLLSELQHRVRNIMGVIRSIGNRSADGAASIDDYRRTLEGRMLALARVQALLTREANAGGSLREIIESEVKVQAHHPHQFELVGPNVMLSPKAVEVLTLAFHELSTNALKYGAFSVPEGTLIVSWSPFEKRGNPWLGIDWIENGAPPRAPSTRRGFGSELIEARIPYELGGTGKVSIEPGGARCRMEFPLKDAESILETDAPMPTTTFGGTIDMSGAPDLTGRVVLVVEDDYYMAADTTSALRGAGAEVLGPCPNEETAREQLETSMPTHAVLDLNLGGGGPRFEIAQLLKAKGIPFVFITGYDPDIIPPDLADVPRLQKPVPFRAIVESVSLL
jgi:PAS domain S-box-containing protein